MPIKITRLKCDCCMAMDIEENIAAVAIYFCDCSALSLPTPSLLTKQISCGEFFILSGLMHIKNITFVTPKIENICFHHICS